MNERGWPAWTAQVNDLIGGWVVTTYPHPLSEHDHREEGDRLKCGYVVADCMTEADAVQIAAALNSRLYVPPLTDPKRWRWVQAGYLAGTQRPAVD